MVRMAHGDKDAFLAPNVIRANKARTSLPLNQPLGPGSERHRTQEHGHTTYRLHIKLCVKDHQVYTVKQIPTLFRRRFQVERIINIPGLDNVAICHPSGLHQATAA
jgi:hypothetical protein